MSLTAEQQAAAYAPQSVCVTAGAGTGKTHMLAERYLYHLKAGASPLEIVAVTFTKRAAAELRSRIRQTVARQAPDRPDWLAELEAAQISTFHNLAARICREHPTAAEVPPDFTILDEQEQPLWEAEQWAIALDKLPANIYAQVPFSTLQAALQAFLQDPLTATAALQRRQADWLPSLQAVRQQAQQDLIQHPVWQQARSVLNGCAGKAGDKLEANRQIAVEAIAQVEAAIEAHANLQPSLDRFKSIKLSGGSQKNWANKEELDWVKSCLKALRNHVNTVQNEGLIHLQITEIDDQIEAMLPALQTAFEHVRSHFQTAKQHQRILDFTDLEVHALKALEHSDVRDDYAQRWHVFLIDEFQDTNPTQGALLAHLTDPATLTLVGDEKQSIYGFRRADVSVFREWRDRIQTQSGTTVSLTTSFRTHKPLVETLNTLFAPVLEELHQSLNAQREAPHTAPHLELYTIAKDAAPTVKLDAAQRRSLEAQHIADRVEDLLNQGIQVWDKATRSPRPLQPGDIAVLSRARAPLRIYGQAIEHRNIPILEAGGGNLLDTREAKDALALLQVLADPSNDIALVALLRSPFFAVSDRILFHLSQMSDATTWWQRLTRSRDDTLQTAAEILRLLLRELAAEPASRLLQLADHHTGYTAVIANLPGGDRRMADWQGILDRVRQIEQNMADVQGVTHRLSRMVRHEITVPRPTLAAANAVTLMTIHSSKGLEWPIVIVPDLARKPPSDYPSVRFDANLGVSFKLEDPEDGEKQKSALYEVLERRQQALDQAEAKRVLYVALTRARDRLILSAADDRGSGISLLQPGLDNHISPHPIPFNADRLMPPPPVFPAKPPIPATQLLRSLRVCGLELPVTALTTYARCPRQFWLKHIDQHPGIPNGNSHQAAAIGKLTHTLLEHGITAREEIPAHLSHLDSAQIQDAFDLAQQFWRSPTYASVRAGTWEQSLQLHHGSLLFNGQVDLMGDRFVLDIKTDQIIHPDEHRFQLWAYATATQKPTAHIAYLRHNHLHTFDPSDLEAIGQEAAHLLKRLAEGDQTPSPSPQTCQYCPYHSMCDAAQTNA